MHLQHLLPYNINEDNKIVSDVIQNPKSKPETLQIKSLNAHQLQKADFFSLCLSTMKGHHTTFPLKTKKKKKKKKKERVVWFVYVFIIQENEAAIIR